MINLCFFSLELYNNAYCIYNSIKYYNGAKIDGNNLFSEIEIIWTAEREKKKFKLRIDKFVTWLKNVTFFEWEKGF